MDRLTNDARRMSILAYFGIGFVAPIIALGCAYALRLYLTGFPKADFEQDIVQFPLVAIPIAITCSIVFAVAGLAVTVAPRMSRLRVMASVLTGSAIAAGFYEFLRPGGLNVNEAFVRGSIAVVGACCVYLALRRYSGMHDRRSPPPPGAPAQ
jgi:hypothetical protein